MHVLVTPMRLRGVALDPKERRRYPAIWGNAMVSSTDCHELGRAANVHVSRWEYRSIRIRYPLFSMQRWQEWQ